MIARWDGHGWRAIGSGLDSVTSSVYAIASWDSDGIEATSPQLIVGGNFGRVGGVQAIDIASWDGVGWSALGMGTYYSSSWDSAVRALVSWDPDTDGPQLPQLIAGGEFDSIGLVFDSSVARWDGEQWRAMGAGLSARVRGLVVRDPDAAGPLRDEVVACSRSGFGHVGGVDRWDGVEWSPVGEIIPDGYPSDYHAICTFDFDGAGPQPAQLVTARSREIVRWDGANWIRFGAAAANGIYSLSSWDPNGGGPESPKLAVGGDIYTIDGVQVRNLASWDGERWQPLGVARDAPVWALMEWDPDDSGPAAPELVIGSSTPLSGIPRPPFYIARWNGAQLRQFGQYTDSDIQTMIEWDRDGAGPLPSVLVAGGSFQTIGDVPASRIAALDGTTWEPLGAGVDEQVNAMVTWDEDGDGPIESSLIVGGRFSTAGGMLSSRIARWHGDSWHRLPPIVVSPLPPYLTSTVSSLTTWSNAEAAPQTLFAAADTAVYRFLGDSWLKLGQFSREVNVMIVWDSDRAGPHPDALYVGGSFTAIAGLPFHNIAHWNGLGWQQVGSGVTGSVRALAKWDPDAAGPLTDELVVAGGFTHAGGMPVSRIAGWDDRNWRPYGNGIPISLHSNTFVKTVINYDADGPGPLTPHLFAGVVLDSTTIPERLFSWDGRSWTKHGLSYLHEINTLTALNTSENGLQEYGLVAVGKLHGGASGAWVPNPGFFARWGCPPGSYACMRGDSTGDDAIAFNDIDCFVAALVDEAAWAGCGTTLDRATYLCANDCDCDGRVGLDDIDHFVQCLVGGACPPCP